MQSACSPCAIERSRQLKVPERDGGGEMEEGRWRREDGGGETEEGRWGRGDGRGVMGEEKEEG